jgi:hypothetical protein
VPVLKDKAGSMGEALATHAGGVSGTFHSSVWERAFNALLVVSNVVGIPVEVVWLMLNTGVEGGEEFHDNLISEY